jgi:peptide/nickel transport system substrate-binding protein
MTELDQLHVLARRPGLSRRQFLSSAAAMGVGATLAVSIYDKAIAQETPRRSGHLIVGEGALGTGDSLDPATTNGPMQLVAFQWGNNLTEFDEDSKLIPELAESWDFTDNRKTWVFKLRKGVQFHNGKELVAQDVIYTLDYHRKPGSKSGALGLLRGINSVKATGKYEVTVTLDATDGDLPAIMADYHLQIMPEGGKVDAGMGTGGYILENVQMGVRITSKRNPNYWKGGRAHVDSVEVLAINDQIARTSALRTGGIHMMDGVDPKTATQLGSIAGLKLYRISCGAHYLFPMRCDMPPFDNIDMRLALKYAINRQELVDKVLFGFGSVGNDQPIPTFDAMYASDIPQYTYDPDKAAFHLKKSGASSTVTLYISDVAFNGAIEAATLYKEHAARAGITINIQREPADSYWSSIWMKKPFFGGNWGGRATPNLLLSLLYTSDATWNECGWKRPDFDKLLVQSRSEFDPAKRKVMFREMELMIHDDGGWIIPMFNDYLDAASTKVKGFKPNRIAPLSGRRAPERVWLEA